MGTVGGVSCTLVKTHKNKKPALTMQSEIYHIVGQDGHGIQLLGKANRRFVFECFQKGTFVAYLAWIAAIEALDGTTVTIVDDESTPQTHTNCYVQETYGDEIWPAVDPNNRFGYIWVTGVKVS